MDSRKIIAFGNSSYVISLPKSWIKENRLNKGDNIFIEEKDGQLAISAGQKEEVKELKSIAINIDKKDRLLIRTEIVSAYLNNHDIIEIRGESIKDEAKEIKEILFSLSGIEIIEETSTKIVVKDLLDMREISIKTLVRRIDNIIRSMIDDSILSIETPMYKSIEDRDMEVNRLVFLSHRVLRKMMEHQQLAKKFNISSIELLQNWVIVTKLEKIGDQTKRIARHLERVKVKKDNKQQIEDIYIGLKKEYLDVMKAYYTNNKEMAFNVEIKKADVIKLCKDFSKEDLKLETSKVIEHFKSMYTSIQNIARAVISG
jgi:phosphate uptake regulator